MSYYQKVDKRPGPNDHYFEHRWKGKTLCFFVEVDETMSRAEWEATIDYERGIGWLHVEISPQEPSVLTETYWATLRRTVHGTVNAAVKGET